MTFNPCTVYTLALLLCPPLLQGHMRMIVMLSLRLIVQLDDVSWRGGSVDESLNGRGKTHLHTDLHNKRLLDGAELQRRRHVPLSRF